MQYGTEKYRNVGLKLTPQRLAILNYLEGNKEHPSAEDVYKAVSKQFPTMSLATVYNTLESLKRRGMIQELTMDPVKKRFDPQPAPHHHLMCVDCRKIVDVHSKFRIHLPEMESEGFEVIGNHIEFYGRCSKCKNKKA